MTARSRLPDGQPILLRETGPVDVRCDEDEDYATLTLIHRYVRSSRGELGVLLAHTTPRADLPDDANEVLLYVDARQSPSPVPGEEVRIRSADAGRVKMLCPAYVSPAGIVFPRHAVEAGLVSRAGMRELLCDAQARL